MMTRPTIYPGANTSAQWFARRYPGSIMELAKPVAVIHTMETTGWPGYGGGATAPTFSIWPGRGIRQHFPVNMSSRALVNASGGVQTNTQGTIQIELVGTCDPSSVVRRLGGIYWPAAKDPQLDSLAGLLAWLHREWGLELTDGGLSWPAYPGSYGNGRGQRMSGRQWLNFEGVCGHMHVPENMHGDPGAFPIGRALQLARGKAGVSPSGSIPSVVSTTRKPFSFVALVWSTYTGKPASHLKLVRSWIGSKSTGKTWDAADMAAYKAKTGKQRPTPATLAPIAEAHGYRLTNTAAGAVAAAQKAALAAYRATQEVRR